MINGFCLLNFINFSKANMRLFGIVQASSRLDFFKFLFFNARKETTPHLFNNNKKSVCIYQKNDKKSIFYKIILTDTSAYLYFFIRLLYAGGTLDLSFKSI